MAGGLSGCKRPPGALLSAQPCGRRWPPEEAGSASALTEEKDKLAGNRVGMSLEFLGRVFTLSCPSG